MPAAKIPSFSLMDLLSFSRQDNESKWVIPMEMTPILRPKVKKKVISQMSVHDRANEVYNFPEVQQTIIVTENDLYLASTAAQSKNCNIKQVLNKIKFELNCENFFFFKYKYPLSYTGIFKLSLFYSVLESDISKLLSFACPSLKLLCFLGYLYKPQIAF